MTSIKANQFPRFFFELHNKHPFPWQTRLAEQVCHQGWPKVIDLPTASGKTACIDIALFALAVRGNDAPRRIFFVVDRRVIVSEAHERAARIAQALARSEGPIVRLVADELKRLAGGEPALDTYELRGGAYRDERWIRTPLQPTVIASTVDQVGSRLLFRGYGISQHSWSMHAGLIANDAIIFLDEAHCSKAFAQTLQAVENYRGGNWSEEPLERPFHFVEMTATPVRAFNSSERFLINDADREHEVLRNRIFASKPTRLAEPVKCKKDEAAKFSAALIDHAVALAGEVDARRISIMVNRVSTAKAVYQKLCEAKRHSLLVIGRMRPLDRDSLTQQWKPLKSGETRGPEDEQQFVVSTQCLEVGADLDFDVLVSECAGIDALQQRFGRLDRLGEFKQARGVIIAAAWQLTGKDGDPVYGEALLKTWNFLESIADNRTVDMGIESSEGDRTVVERLRRLPEEDRIKLILQGENAPALLPSHVDALVQTSPTPQPEPFVDYFLHGRRHGAPDVGVVWRSDLDETNLGHWRDIVALCPPSSSEAMPVPLWLFRNWFDGEALQDESDLEVVSQVQEQEVDSSPRRAALIWRGRDDASIAKSAADFRPGDTVLLPSSSEAWNEFGFKPDGCPPDRGDEARFLLRKRICLRLHPQILNDWQACPSRDALQTLVSDPDTDPNAIWDALDTYPEELRPPALKQSRPWLDRNTLSAYPDGPGWVVEGYYGEKKSLTGKTVLLEDHLTSVEAAIETVVGDLLSSALKSAAQAAARYHDYGKADTRYQAWLRNGDFMAAQYAPKPIAKSRKTILRRQTDCGLPEDFRHELLSLLFVAKAADVGSELRDLVLHLVASHHGRCRPLAPDNFDEDPACVTFGALSVCRSERIDRPPSSLGSGVADRFWKLTRRYGWWGLSYLEAMLRLADWQASDDEQSEVSE